MISYGGCTPLNTASGFFHVAQGGGSKDAYQYVHVTFRCMRSLQASKEWQLGILSRYRGGLEKKLGLMIINGQVCVQWHPVSGSGQVERHFGQADVPRDNNGHSQKLTDSSFSLSLLYFYCHWYLPLLRNSCAMGQLSKIKTQVKISYD